MAAHMEDVEADIEDGPVSIGTAFEVLETDEDVMKAKGKKDKEFYVLDKQGRRRFHGAFTGGFSAGYFMSVGTKEGWSPAPFVSSRSQKASRQQQRPEDYMDDEDLDSFGIAPRQVSTKDKFAPETQAPPTSHDRKRPSVIPGDPLLHTLVVPTRTTIGALLMKGMGWREGRGVGPTTVAMDTPPVKTYGCALPGNEGVELGPGDVSAWAFSGGKDNLHGIGYRGMTRDHFTSSHGFNKGVYGMSGQAFGVGALEEDDDDIYSQETVAAYNASLATPTDHTLSNYGWTGGKDVGESWSLSSFIKTSIRHRYSQVYPPPIIPQGFIPVHKFPVNSGSDHTHTPVKNIAERGFLATGSVFDLVAPQDRDRLLKAKDTPIMDTVANNEIGFSLDNYQPFKEDPGKQSRYNAYLQGNRGAITAAGMTEWERQKEVIEFDRVAKVHGPLTTTLSDRFTHATETKDDGGEGNTSVHPTDVNMFGSLTRSVEEWHPHRILCKRFNIPDPYPHSDTVGIKSDHHHQTVNNPSRSMTFQPSTTQYHPPTLPNTIQTPIEQQIEEEPEVDKPSITFLKSVFEDSSSEEEMEIQHPPPGPALSLATPTPPTESTITNRRPHPQDNPPVSIATKPTPNHTPDHTPDTRWQNLATVIQPTLSVPQKMEEPIVYVKDTFGPALPPTDPALPPTHEVSNKDNNRNHGNHSHKKHSSKHKHHKHHHNKVKKKHKHKRP